MKTTIDLPDDLVRQVKMRAVAEGRSFKDLIADCLRRGLERQPSADLTPPPREGPLTIGPAGLPLFHCRPDAPAARSTVEDLLLLEQRLQAEEDKLRAGCPD
jgi:hypothetical protein